MITMYQSVIVPVTFCSWSGALTVDSEPAVSGVERCIVLCICLFTPRPWLHDDFYVSDMTLKSPPNNFSRELHATTDPTHFCVRLAIDYLAILRRHNSSEGLLTSPLLSNDYRHFSMGSRSAAPEVWEL